MSDIEDRLRAGAPLGVRPPDVEAAAARAGLVDVAYATVESPFGTFVVASTEAGLVRLALTGERTEDVLDELAARVSPRVLRSPSRTEGVRRELDEYFAGRRTVFELAIDWRLTKGFTRKVLVATARIPYGSVSSYSALARTAGSPRAARAAGNALHNNPVPIVVPCHRVLHADGGMGGYGGGLPMKEALLRLEGAI